MATVTALRATRRGGVALHIDGEFVCTVSESLVARWRLHQDRELTDEDVVEIRAQSSAERVAGDAYRLLGHRARSREELRRRLLDKGHDEQAVAGVVERLTEERLLDDVEFARSYVADKRSLAGWGSTRILAGLASFGVDPGVAEAAVAAAGESEADEVDRALALLNRRGPPRPPLEAARRRAYQALMRRGFGGAVAYAAVRRWSGEAPPSSET